MGVKPKIKKWYTPSHCFTP